MSRSNPTADSPHPCSRWFEWDGKKGVVYYYDKEKKENVEVGGKFTFILLDRLSVIKGWHKKSDSGITSNEVRDIRADTLLVRSFKGGTLAEGLYSQIKDTITAKGGKFGVNCYIGYKDEKGGLALGSILFKGSSLGAWMDFEKENRKALYDKAAMIVGHKSGKSGGIDFEMPVFALKDISDETNKAATNLDREELQPYLKEYFKRTHSEKVKGGEEHHPEDESQDPPPDDRRDHGESSSMEYDPSTADDDDDIPF